MSGITLYGFKEFNEKLKNLPQDLQEEVDQEAIEAGLDWAQLSIEEANSFKDNGDLANGITTYPVEGGSEVVSNAFYSPYMEWGTKGRAKVPGELSSYAAQFSGKGKGDYYDFLNAILDWVKRKGIASRFSVKTHRVLKHTKSDDDRMVDAAQAIALSIIRHGVHPHPFFFIQKPIVEKNFIERLTRIINTPH